MSINRSKGIIILALFMIVAHLSSNTSGYADYFGGLGSFFSRVAVLNSVLACVIGVGLLFGGEIFRRALLGFAGFSIVNALAQAMVASQHLGRQLPTEATATKSFMIYFGAGVVLLVCAGYIYFFTRPQVKQQFSSEN